MPPAAPTQPGFAAAVAKLREAGGGGLGPAPAAAPPPLLSAASREHLAILARHALADHYLGAPRGALKG